VARMATALRKREGVSGLLEELTDNSRDLYHNLLVLYFAYAFRRYDPKYEKYEMKYGNKKIDLIDLTVSFNNKRILFEIKTKHVANSEIRLCTQFKNVKPEIIKVLEAKFDVKYRCVLRFSNIPCKYDDDHMSKLLDSIPQKVQFAVRNIRVINEWEPIVLQEACGHDIGMSLVFTVKDEKWHIGIGSGGELNPRFTWSLLEGIFKKGFFPKFKHRQPQDLTIGIIDISKRDFVLSQIQNSCDLVYARPLLKRIMESNSTLADFPVDHPITETTIEAARCCIDGIFLIGKPWNVFRCLKVEKFINSRVCKEKASIISKLYDNLPAL